jgi:bacillithiol biosynthesis cysteine-adding enzyme BshC
MKRIPLAYADTGLFSELILDYLSGKPELQHLYRHQPDLDGIRASMHDRDAYGTNRIKLVETLKKQYAEQGFLPETEQRLDALLKPNAYTVCTAHQPNLFTGPLYVIYKILHAIKLADTLNEKFPESHFIPVYYMGSEDADLDELGYTQVAGQKKYWNTNQQGAVGRMKVDVALLQLIETWYAQSAHLPHAGEVHDTLIRYFKLGIRIQNATFSLLHHWFGDKGLLILIPDDADLKKATISLWEAELNESFIQRSLKPTQDWLAENYSVQANGRDINLFYLEDQQRNRIVKEAEQFRVLNTVHVFSRDEMRQILEKHPERMSPNVLLRPLFQEMILPNVAFIGGGGEMAYWLSLKSAFDDQGIPFPALFLRHSFVILEDSMTKLFERLQFPTSSYFGEQTAFENRIAKSVASDWPDFSKHIASLSEWYRQRADEAKVIDPTLEKHVLALEQNAMKRIASLEKKLMRSIRRREADSIRQATKIRSYVMPGGGFQERVEHGLNGYARYGAELLDLLYANLDPFDPNASWLLLD